MIDFLEYIWSGHADPLSQEFYEFRLMKEGETPIQHWLKGPRISESSPLIVTIKAADELGWDVYFGVMPRQKQIGKNEYIRDWTQLLWADIDTKDGASRLDIFNRLKNHADVPDPQLIVDSGRGFHFYWALDTPMEWSQAGLAMKGLADMLGGDHVYDKARILRVPGTHNHKTNPPSPVRMMRYDLLAGQHSHDMFAAAIDRGYDLEHPRNDVSNRVFLAISKAMTDAGGGIPAWLIEKMKYDPGKGQRSEYAFGVVCNLVELGQTDQQIEELVQEFADGFGVKYFDRNMGSRWLGYTIKAARKAVEGGR